MNAGFDIVFARNLRDQLTIADVALVEGNFGWHGVAMTAEEVVENDNAFSARSQEFTCHTSDITRTTRNQYHAASPLLFTSLLNGTLHPVFLEMS